MDGKYSDYSLSAPNRLLIIEAKKEGIYFELPLGKSRIIYDIMFFKKNNSDIYKAIEQTVKYCQDRGTLFGAVTNGHQLIAFLGSRTDGISPLCGKAVAFDTLDRMQEDFLSLWQCLSKVAIQAHHLAVKLQESTTAPPPEKHSKRLVEYPGFKNRNDLQTNLQILGDLMLEDITRVSDEQEFLEHCYSESGALSQYALISKSILKTRYSALFEQASEGPTLLPTITKGGVNPEIIAESISRRPILLLGDVGVGKTMFIHHFIKIDSRELMEKSIIIYVDFGVKPILPQDLRSYLADEIKGQLLRGYSTDIEEKNFVYGVYHGELNRFKRGIYSSFLDSDPTKFHNKEIQFLEKKLENREDHLRESLSHVSKGQKKQIIVFLDNIDQRPDEFQQEIFLVSQSLAETWPITVFVSMRPETFYQSRKAGTLSAYHPKAFTIAPPRVDRVIEKRLKYTVSILDAGKLPSLRGVTFQLDALRDYLRAILYSFQNERPLIEFIDNICGGNIRLALDFIRRFIGSGHVATQKIIDIYKKQEQYNIPLHEFLRAVIYGDHIYFNPRASEILNVFDISSPNGREHFLMPIILAQLDRWSQSSTSSGFVASTIVNQFSQDLGFQPSQIDFALRRALTNLGSGLAITHLTNEIVWGDLSRPFWARHAAPLRISKHMKSGLPQFALKNQGQRTINSPG